jgi:hypothetical protein
MTLSLKRTLAQCRLRNTKKELHQQLIMVEVEK